MVGKPACGKKVVGEISREIIVPAPVRTDFLDSITTPGSAAGKLDRFVDDKLMSPAHYCWFHC